MPQENAEDWQQEEAGNPATSTQRLKIVSTDPTLRSIVAGNLVTSADLLELLAQDRDIHVRQAVAGNPNTPWKNLEQLAWEFPDAFLANPVGSLQLLVHPEQISTDEVFWNIQLRVAAIPSLWWNWLRNHPILGMIPSVRLHRQYASEAIHPYGTQQVGEERTLLILLELLTVARLQGVALPVVPANILPDRLGASVEQLVEEHLWWLAWHGDGEVRRAIAENPQTPLEILRMLARDQETQVHQAAAWNLQMIKEAPAPPICEQDSVLERVFAHLPLPEQVLRVLARDHNAEVREAVASHPQTPAEVLHTLAQDESLHVRLSLLKNAQNPGEALYLLAQDIEASLRMEVAFYSQTPGAILRHLAQDQEGFVRQAVARNARTPEELLRLLAGDQEGFVRQAVARNARTPGEVLCLLAEDTRANVREAVATHPQVSGGVLGQLAQDASANVREAVARNSRTPVEALGLLAEDRAWRVLQAVAVHPQMPGEILRSLAQKRYPGVRKAVAANPQVPEDVLHMLARDHDEDVRQAVAVHPRVSVEVLHMLARDHDAEVRKMVASHPQTPGEIMQILLQDQASTVRFLARLMQRLVVEIEGPLHEYAWREKLLLLFLDGQDGDFLVDESIEQQLDGVAELAFPEHVRRTITATFADDWDGAAIRGTYVASRTDFPRFLQSKRKYYQCILAPFLPATALQKLAESPSWEVRYLVALHAQTSRETRQRLSQDGNRYVRALAKAKSDTK